MSLIAALVAVPLIAAVLLMLFRSESQRNVITIAAAAITGVTAVAFAVQYLFVGHVSFALPQETSFFATWVFTAIDIVLCAVILWHAVRYKNRLALVLGLVQTVGVIAFANMTLSEGAGHMLPEPLYSDQLSVIMVLIVGLVGSAICVYALGYMHDFQHHEPAGAPDRRHFFSALMFIFLSAMFVIVLSDNLEWLFTGWEITTVCSFLMIGYTRTDEAIKNSFSQINLNMIGGLAFLAALIMLHFGGIELSLAAFIETALSYCREVDGLFDVTMGSATQLWNFKDCMIPARDDVAAALRHVDYRGVIVNDAVVTLRDPLACVDLGGIAKGYIADGILALLRERGVEHALVNLGGNVAVMGGKPDGAPWRVGVRRPLPSSSMPLLDSFAVLALRDGSAVTSGIYERAFEQDGKLYPHILDPRTGFPAETDLLSATVVAQSSLDADGYTTALIMMGADRALAFAEQHPALEAVLVTTEGDVLATSGIGDRVLFELLG